MFDLIALIPQTSIQRAGGCLAVCLLLVSMAIGDTGANPFQTSARRINIVQSQADKFVEGKGFEGLSEAEVYDIVVNAVIEKGIDCKLRPTGDLVTIETCKEAAQAKALAATEKALPEPSAEELAEQAAAKYPLLQKGDPLKAVFTPNPARRLKVEGPYEGFDGKHVLVNHKRYALESLKIIEPQVEDPRLLIDAEQNAEKRQTFQESAHREYLRQRSQMLEREREKALRIEVSKAIASNEKNGFIFYERQWHSLKDVVKTEIARRRDAWLEAKRAEEERIRREAEEAARRAAEEAARRAAEEAGEQPGEGLPPSEGIEFDLHGQPVIPRPGPPRQPGAPEGEPFRPKEPAGDEGQNRAPESLKDVFRPAVPDRE